MYGCALGRFEAPIFPNVTILIVRQVGISETIPIIATRKRKFVSDKEIFSISLRRFL